MRKSPSMTGLRVLEAVVRTGSLSGAARELCVTPAAISHRLRDLEAQSGVPLVHRRAGRFVATPLGQNVLDAVGDAFVRIRTADSILSGKARSTLRVIGSYSFAVLWLAPRLARFQARHLEAKLFLDPSHDPLDQTLANVTILHAVDPPERAGWVRLFADRCAAVAQPGHPLFTGPGASPEGVLGARLVHVAHGKGSAWGEFSWHQWAKALALTGPVPSTGPTVTAEHLAVDLVLAEEALALVSLVNASRLISQRKLRAIAGSEVATGCSYWARLNDTGGRADRLAEEFLDWVQDELAEANGATA